MGFLLSGLSQPSAIAPIDLPILYEDEWLIAVNKPAGLLSVPGRHRDRQDSVLSRLNDAFTSKRSAFAIHRLDQETSGVLLLARDRDTARHVAQQFERRQVQKKYEAVLAGRIQRDWGDRGVIDLPLAADLSDRPRQKVDWQRGKPSLTQFRVIAAEAETTRVEFLPVTGRTHQLRVHAVEGLGTVILGDRLYGCRASVDRLHLHARALTFHHPHSGQVLQLQAELPF
jgi:tRNA pseudouridine32 synthase/23S rRNA pseudouridine746 synthase